MERADPKSVKAGVYDCLVELAGSVDRIVLTSTPCAVVREGCESVTRDDDDSRLYVLDINVKKTYL